MKKLVPICNSLWGHFSASSHSSHSTVGLYFASFCCISLLIAFFPSPASCHICDNIFRQADKLVIKAEVSNLVLEKEASFKVYMQSNMKGSIWGTVRLTGKSQAFNIDVYPAEGFYWITPGQRYEYTVNLKLKPGFSSGNYTVDFDAMVGDRKLRSYSMKMALEDKTQGGSFLTAPVFSGDAPLIDGRLSEECWKDALQVQTTLNTRNDKPAYPAAVFFTGDSSTLYIAAAVRENGRQNQHGNSSGSTTGPDKPGDSLMVLAAPPGSQTVYCFEASRSGELMVSSVENGKRVVHDADMSSVRAAVIQSNRVWYVEMCIPLKSMGIDTGLPGETWRMNVVREYRNSQWETSFWSGSPDTYLRPEAFGELVFAP